MVPSDPPPPEKPFGFWGGGGGRRETAHPSIVVTTGGGWTGVARLLLLLRGWVEGTVPSRLSMPGQENANQKRSSFKWCMVWCTLMALPFGELRG